MPNKLRNRSTNFSEKFYFLVELLIIVKRRHGLCDFAHVRVNQWPMGSLC